MSTGIRWRRPGELPQPCELVPGCHEPNAGEVEGKPGCGRHIAAIAADEADALLRQRSRLPRPRSDGALEGAP